MGFTRAVRLGALAVAAAGVLAQPAAAETSATGKVVAFLHEFTELKVYENPIRCVSLPPGAHVISNQTDQVIIIYSDPLCLVPIEPFARIKPGYGTHVSAVGSFAPADSPSPFPLLVPVQGA